MDITVLFKLSYGLYVVGAMDNNRPTGCIINTCFQVTSENPILAISMNKDNYTLKAIKDSGRFSLSIIDEDTDGNIIPTFGFQSSRDADKYSAFGYDMLLGTPIVKGKFAGRLVMEVLNMIDNETHVVILGRLIETQQGEGVPMTYEYYHRVIKGKAPKNAPTYASNVEVTKDSEKIESEKKRYVCDVCGYVVEADDLPDDYVCPCCKMPREHFVEK